MFGDVFIKTFSGLLSIRKSRREIIHLNDNFRNWIKMHTAINPTGMTNVQLAKVAPDNAARIFTTCRDASVEFQKNNSTTHEFTGADNGKYLSDNPEIFGDKRAIFIDLDMFKLINEYGRYEVGHDVLRCFAARLRKDFPDKAAIIRPGGDEFLLVPGDDPFTDALSLRPDELRAAFERIHEKCKDIFFSCGIGVKEEDISRNIAGLNRKMHLDRQTRKYHSCRICGENPA